MRRSDSEASKGSVAESGGLVHLEAEDGSPEHESVQAGQELGGNVLSLASKAPEARPSRLAVEDAIFEARMRTAKRARPLMPWEKGSMRYVFGTDNLPTPPSIEQPIDLSCAEAAPRPRQGLMFQRSPQRHLCTCLQ